MLEGEDKNLHGETKLGYVEELVSKNILIEKISLRGLNQTFHEVENKMMRTTLENINAQFEQDMSDKGWNITNGIVRYLVRSTHQWSWSKIGMLASGYALYTSTAKPIFTIPTTKYIFDCIGLE